MLFLSLLRFFFITITIIIITITNHSTIIMIVIIKNYYCYLFSLSFLFRATLSDRLKKANKI